MRFRIVHDRPGRIRLRAGAYAFDRVNEAPLEKRITALPYVITAQVHAANGGILILYQPGHRDELLLAISSYDKNSVRRAICSADDKKLLKIDRRFERKLAKHVVKHVIFRRCLPFFLRNIRIGIKAAYFIMKGISSLFNSGLTVEVLDAASISAALITGDRKTASSVMFLLQFSSIMEDYTKSRTEASLAQSLAMHASHVWLVQEDGTELLIPIGELKVGDSIRIQTGSAIPVDGTVASGEALVNQAAITGEPLAVEKRQGSSVFAGTLAQEGEIFVETRAVGSQTKVQGILSMIDSSERLKVSSQVRSENLANQLVKCNFILSAATFLFTGGEESLEAEGAVSGVD